MGAVPSVEIHCAKARGVAHSLDTHTHSQDTEETNNSTASSHKYSNFVSICGCLKIVDFLLDSLYNQKEIPQQRHTQVTWHVTHQILSTICQRPRGSNPCPQNYLTSFWWQQGPLKSKMDLLAGAQAAEKLQKREASTHTRRANQVTAAGSCLEVRPNL